MTKINISNNRHTFLRETIYKKLKKANSQLPSGMHFCLYEGYRSLNLQKMIFDEQYKNVTSRHPDWSLNDIFNETIKLVAPRNIGIGHMEINIGHLSKTNLLLYTAEFR